VCSSDLLLLSVDHLHRLVHQTVPVDFN